MKKDKLLNTILIVSVVLAVVTLGTWTVLANSWGKKFGRGIEPTVEVDWENETVDTISVDTQKEVDIDNLFVENVEVDESKNILYLPETYTPPYETKSYTRAPFFLEIGVDYTGMYLNKTSDSFLPWNSDTFGEVEELYGKFVVPVSNLCIPIGDKCKGGVVAAEWVMEKNSDTGYDWRDTYETNEIECVVGHSVGTGMGALTGHDGRSQKVSIGDIAYIIKDNGEVKIYRAVRIDKHANEQRYNTKGWYPSDFWFSDGEVIDAEYKGTDIDLLYTDCCNDNDDYDPNEGYNRDNDPGNYAILWERIN